MKTCFNDLIHSGKYAPKSLLTSILPASAILVLAAGIFSCSGQNSMFSSGANSRLQFTQVSVSAEYQQPQAINLESRSGGLGLVSSGTNLKVEVPSSTCATGYTVGASGGVAITSVVNLYKGDIGCKIKLRSFDFQGFTYTDTNHGATALASPWDTSVVGTFSKVASGSTAADLIKVFITTQVASPVPSSGATVVFKFTDISAGTTSTLSQSAVSTAVSLSAEGKDAPRYHGANTVSGGGVAFARYLSTNSDGSANMSFTIVCNIPVTGASVPYTCPNVDGSGDIQGTAANIIRYTMLPDTYNSCVSSSPTTLTVASANAAFSGTAVFTGQTVYNVAATDASGTTGASPGQIKAAAADSWGNTGITNGGFDTVSMLTGATPIYSGASGSYANGYQYLNDLLVLQRRDSSGNVLSYLYYCINIAAITQS